MKSALLVLLGILWSGSLGSAQEATPAMNASFLAKFKTSIATKDFSLFSALICRDGTLDARTTQMLETFNPSIFHTLAISSDPTFQFAPIPEGQVTSFTRDGKTYGLNLKVIEILAINFPNAPPNTSEAQTLRFPLGIKNGRIMIAQVEEKPLGD